MKYLIAIVLITQAALFVRSAVAQVVPFSASIYNFENSSNNFNNSPNNFINSPNKNKEMKCQYSNWVYGL
jgi:hypothetical protein